MLRLKRFFNATLIIVLIITLLAAEIRRYNLAVSTLYVPPSKIYESAKDISKQTKVVVIDPGHGGDDPGGIGKKGTMEKDIALSVSLKLGVLLEEEGFKVIYTRKIDAVSWSPIIKKNLIERANISNDVKADIFISIHLNTFKIESVKGTETFYNEKSSQSKYLSELIQDQIIKDVNSNDRGIKTERFSVFRNVKAPAVLVELGYITNLDEEILLNTSSYQEKLAAAMAKGILNYFKQ